MITRRIRKQLNNELILKQWKNTLIGVPCFIIGNSPYLDDYPIYKLKNYFTIGINRAFKRIDPTILIWQDFNVYSENVEEFKKLKCIFYSRNIANPADLGYNFVLEEGQYKLPENPAFLYGRGSTGPLAFQLAYSLGCNPIILLGCNCKYKNNKTDFYGNNKYHNEFTLKNCNIGLKWMKSLKIDRKIIFLPDENLKLEDILETLELENLDIKNTIDSLDVCSLHRQYYQNKIFMKEVK